jgi:sodium/potassium-transporting ATPase subunit alpha
VIFQHHTRLNTFLINHNRYRTLSIRVDEKDLPGKPKKSADPADAIAAIDVHLITTDDVYTRYSCSPNVGLEPAAVLRRAKDGKNIISPPPTQYWMKALNYVFGGFNFLMWIAFIVTLVRAASWERSSSLIKRLLALL